ncbi:MAG: hypothetical protein ABI970_13840 [Chloroflexota bacterium]
MRSEDSTVVIQQLQNSLTNLGYTLYNPFGLIPGKAYPRSVRLFVAPAVGGWVKVMGEPDEAQLAPLSQHTILIYTALTGSDADIWVYADGQAMAIESALIPYLRPNLSADDLQKALHTTSNIIQTDQPDSGLPFNALPDDIKAMAGKVDAGQAQKMFARMSGDFIKKISKVEGQADAARDLISGGAKPDWNSIGGARIRAVMNCLTIGDQWREPDFDDLRDAYPLLERRRRSPNARTYPGDDAVMAKVPDALTYTPVYGGAS